MKLKRFILRKNSILKPLSGDENPIVIAKGGVGGKGLTGKRWQDRRWNSEAEKERAKSWITGQRGECIKAFVELKRIADVGFIGFPNAGKSTLLKALSKANPQISAAPFTTIRPNIGVIKVFSPIKGI